MSYKTFGDFNLTDDKQRFAYLTGEVYFIVKLMIISMII